MQIIQSGPSEATLRQQALNEALQGAIQGYAAYDKQKKDEALTKRQQALQEQALQAQKDAADLQATLKLTEMGVASPLADVKAYAKGTYQPKEISPAVAATPDQITETKNAPISSPADLRMQDETGGVRSLQLGTEAKPAVMGPANPLTNYTEAKKAKVAADLHKQQQEQMLLDSKVENIPLEKQQKQETINKLQQENKYRPEEIFFKRTDAQFKRSQISDKLEQKDLENFRKAHDPSVASSRSPIGKEFSKYQQAQHALKLVEEFGDNLDNVSSMKKRELAVTLATMLSPGLPHESTIAHLDEPTLNSYLAEKMQAITGKPAGTNSGEMVRQLKDSVVSQADLSLQNISRYQKGVEASYLNKIKNNPELYQGIMDQTRIQGAPSFSSRQSMAPKITTEHLNAVKAMSREEKLALINGG